MKPISVPATLQARLGTEPTRDLVQMMTAYSQSWTEHALGEATLRFDRSLSRELTSVRTLIIEGDARLHGTLVQGLAEVRREMTEGQAALRQEMTAGRETLRQEMTAGHEALRQEMTAGHEALRQKMAAGHEALRQEMTALREDWTKTRVDLLRWSFVFWTGQVTVVIGLLAFMSSR